VITDIIVVRAEPSRPRSDGWLFRTGLRRTRGRGGLAPAKVEVFSGMRAKDVKDLARDPTTLDWTYSFKTRLIGPTARRKATSGRAWGLDAIGATASSLDATGVVVAVLDTGIERSHPAFKGIEIVEGDFSGDGNGDVHGHGTHCAGTIFGRDVPTRIGVARGVKNALIGKVLGDDGGGDSAALINGMRWALAKGAHVISMSVALDFTGQVAMLKRKYGRPLKIAASIALDNYRRHLRLFDSVLDTMRKEAEATRREGCVVVAASGNESRRDENAAWSVNVSLPAAAAGVVAVGAVRRAGKRLAVASFSNSNPRIVAPGVGIISANHRGGLIELDGTSMACPHVAGAAALWWEKLRPTSPNVSEAVVAKLISGASLERFTASTEPEHRGEGLVRCPD